MVESLRLRSRLRPEVETPLACIAARTRPSLKVAS